ncbi:MAG: insulinase family protein [Chloroflexi bacterium]|nr:insulinase family protein [Chloroflexota bacterium]
MTRAVLRSEGVGVAFEPQITTLSNGLRVVVTPMPAAQAAAVALFVGVGSRHEVPRTNGLSHFIEHMLFKGTERRPTAPEISEAIEGAGGGLNAFTTREVTCYWNNLPFERAATGIEVLADMVQRSLLDPEELERERPVVQQEIRRAHDSPGSKASELLSTATFGDQPIGWPVAGTIETVQGVTRDDFIAHMNTYYTTGNCVLSIAGNVDPDKVTVLAEREFDALPVGDAATPAMAHPGRPAEDYVVVEDRPIEQTNLALSVHGIQRNDPDRYALDIMNTALGRGMSSRLFKEVRERRGLAYSVGSGSARFWDIGTISVSAGVTREHQEEALEVILAELRRLVDEPMADDELTRTKDFAAGSFRLSLETPMSFSQRWGTQLLHDNRLELPDETVAGLRAVTAEDIQRVASRVFGSPEFSLAVVGPSASVERLDEILHGR